MGLVAVAGFQSHVDERGRGANRELVQRSLKASQATVEFWSQAQAIVEQRDESAVAVAAFLDCLTDIGAGPEPAESLGHRRMQGANGRKPLRQKRFEDIELPMRSAGLHQPFPHFLHIRTPEILDRSMSPGELSSRCAKEEFGCTGMELRPHRTDRSGDLTHIKCCSCSPDDRVTDAVPKWIRDLIEEAQRVIGKPEYQVHVSRREDALSIGRHRQ